MYKNIIGRHYISNSTNASDHQAGYHVLDNTIPSMHCPSALRLDQHGWKYTHAKMEADFQIICGFAQEKYVKFVELEI
jgi:hypothetical protein